MNFSGTVPSYVVPYRTVASNSTFYVMDLRMSERERSVGDVKNISGEK